MLAEKEKIKLLIRKENVNYKNIYLLYIFIIYIYYI
jgi:hypothetical protein